MTGTEKWVISVGNLSTGGTGKSPHIEYLVRLLGDEFRIATLSRGYGRKTRGFRMAEATSTPEQVGDEPCQFKQKFPELPVAVAAKRVMGIQALLSDQANLQSILLDDAFQHRAVKPGISILLTEFKRPYFEDQLLPTGNLREWRHGSHRADIILVTKTPEAITHIEKREFIHRLRPRAHQKVYFTHLKYGTLQPLNGMGNPAKLLSNDYYFERDFGIVWVAGIAHPEYLHQYLETKVSQVKGIPFPDHHVYSPRDIRKIRKIFDTFGPAEKIILTTEKDAMRLAVPGVSELIEDLPVFYLPIEVVFEQKDREPFHEHILSYVRKNQGNSGVPPNKG
ncbi:MAG: tetraacyldisaccharide 4'-kinase, partial [Bacteroidota bacterium]